MHGATDELSSSSFDMWLSTFSDEQQKTIRDSFAAKRKWEYVTFGPPVVYGVSTAPCLLRGVISYGFPEEAPARG